MKQNSRNILPSAVYTKYERINFLTKIYREHKNVPIFIISCLHLYVIHVATKNVTITIK